MSERTMLCSHVSMTNWPCLPKRQHHWSAIIGFSCVDGYVLLNPNAAIWIGFSRCNMFFMYTSYHIFIYSRYFILQLFKTSMITKISYVRNANWFILTWLYKTICGHNITMHFFVISRIILFFVKVWITRFGAVNRLEMCVDGAMFVELCCA